MPDPTMLARLRERLGRPAAPAADRTRVALPPRPATIPTLDPESLMSDQDRAISRAAQFIAGHEGFREKAYRDKHGRGEPWTVGYGRTGPDVGPDTRMTLEEGQRWLEQRVRRDANQMRQAGVEPHPALLSFAYNLGYPTLVSSGILDAALQGNWQDVADSMAKYTKGRQDGRLVELPGLVRRRREEVNMLQDLLRGIPTDGDTPRTYQLAAPR